MLLESLIRTLIQIFSKPRLSSFLNNEFLEPLLLNIEAVIWMPMFCDRNLMNILQIPAALKGSSLVRCWRQEENSTALWTQVRMSVAQKRDFFFFFKRVDSLLKIGRLTNHSRFGIPVLTEKQGKNILKCTIKKWLYMGRIQIDDNVRINTAYIWNTSR